MPLLVQETKKCGACGAENALAARTCTACGEPFSTDRHKASLEDFQLSEVDLLQMSPYRWEQLFEGKCWIAYAFDAWAIVLNFQGRWLALGGRKEQGLRLIGDSAEQVLALVSADDFLREAGDMEAAAKSKRWLSLPPTDQQLKYLGLTAMTAMGMSRYRACCCLCWVMNERGVKRRLEDYKNRPALAA
jgi:hypothetical protein